MSLQGLEGALDAMTFDPYPTKDFRAALVALKSLQTLLEKTTKTTHINVVRTIEELSVKMPENWMDVVKYTYLPSTMIRKIVDDNKASEFVNSSLGGLLSFITAKIRNGDNHDAESILRDFKSLLSSIVFFKDYFQDDKELENSLRMFVHKIISMRKKLRNNNCAEKIKILNVMRLITIGMGKHAVLAVMIIQKLHREIKLLLEELNALDSPPKSNKDAMMISTFLDYIFILNEVVNGAVLEQAHQESPEIMSDLKQVLKDATLTNNKYKLKRGELFIVNKIIRCFNNYDDTHLRPTKWSWP